MAIGYLVIQARTANDAIPLSGAQISIMDEQGEIVRELTTDESGETEVVSLETVDRALSLEPDYTGTPYTAYNILARASGFDTLFISGVPIFEGETAIHAYTDGEKAAQSGGHRDRNRPPCCCHGRRTRSGGAGTRTPDLAAGRDPQSDHGAFRQPVLFRVKCTGSVY